MIDGVIIKKLKQIPDKRGKVMHMLRHDSEIFDKFGEIYFSTVNPNAIKAWKKHFRMTQHLAVPLGLVRLAIFDDRINSTTKGLTQEIVLGEKDYFLVKIPPLLWYGFKGISNETSLIANCTDIPHDPDEIERKDTSDKYIPYNW